MKTKQDELSIASMKASFLYFPSFLFFLVKTEERPFDNTKEDNIYIKL